MHFHPYQNDLDTPGKRWRIRIPGRYSPYSCSNWHEHFLLKRVKLNYQTKDILKKRNNYRVELWNLTICLHTSPFYETQMISPFLNSRTSVNHEEACFSIVESLLPELLSMLIYASFWHKGSWWSLSVERLYFWQSKNSKLKSLLYLIVSIFFSLKRLHCLKMFILLKVIIFQHLDICLFDN